MSSLSKIRDHVEVTPQPTVVRLDHLGGENAHWITESYYITPETERHLHSLRVLFEKDSGCGVFLVGHYGSGKSHFLAYVVQQLQAKTFTKRNPAVIPISLVNYKAAETLESIIERELDVPSSGGDRRNTWNEISNEHQSGLVLILDELSEFLRSKPSVQSFNEDLRFLQFLGEWADGRALWIVAALQEQIEHTGEIEYDLFRKIKDRYPIRLLLTPSHVRDLIGRRILRKKASYPSAVEALAKEFKKIYPDDAIDYGLFCEIYPLHPVTLELLEEVRDRFSQARGIIDFTITQLGGNDARGVEPFLDQPWGRLLTPNTIIDHFADLFEVQPEFLPIAQRVLPYCREQIPVLLPNKAQQELAWNLMKLLILVHLSPRRSNLSIDEASQWLMLRVSSIHPEKNREIVKRIFETLAGQGAYVKQEGAEFRLDLEDDSKQYLDDLLSKTVIEIEHRGDSVFESLTPLLEGCEFNPFSLPRDRWHARKVRWHFHDWNVQIYFGGGSPSQQNGLTLQIGLPWGPAADGPYMKVLPGPLESSAEIVELAALCQLKERPLPARVLNRISERIATRSLWLNSLIRAAYMEASVKDGSGMAATGPLPPRDGGFNAWLNGYGEWLLRVTYPLFERFAPGSGPLPREAYRQFMKFAAERDLVAADAPEFVKLIREAYLVPMGLMQRKGMDYVMNPKLDANELVRLLAPILPHHPSPARVYEHLSSPVYGLVPDQIQLLLLVLLIQGELDILKGDRSYRDVYDTLISPLQYDTVVPGHALSVHQLRHLQMLCEGFQIPVPKQWSVLAQKRTVDQLRKYGRGQRDLLSGFLTKLKEFTEAAETISQIEELITKWLALEKGDHEIHAFQHFEAAVSPVPQFVIKANEAASLPQRFERLLRETQRFRHLFSHPAIAESSQPELAAPLAVLQNIPPLTLPEAVDEWIERANAFYRRYQQAYRERHEQWREAMSRHPIWSYPIPVVARSRHVMAGDVVREIESAIAKARTERCVGLSSLEFQPVCRCGFDGEASPLNETVRLFEKASEKLETALRLFFQQERVKARLRDWVSQGLEINTAALAYLEGTRNYPDVQNLALFDQHLSGLDLVKPVDTETLVELIADRAWEKSALMKTIDELFNRAGPRIVFRRSNGSGHEAKEKLVAWCYEQALRTGSPLPPVFSRDEQKLAAERIDPRWVAPASLAKLDQMGLGESAVQRVLDMILKGAIRVPEDADVCAPVHASTELLNPHMPDRAGPLAEQIESLYTQHERMMKVAPDAWLALLNRLAAVELVEMPKPLEEILNSHRDAQWIVVDCLGLPLLSVVRRVLRESLQTWQLREVDFAIVSPRTSTEAFYETLIEHEFKKSFEKINAIDRIIHERNVSMNDLTQLARAELEIAFKQLSRRLDSTKPVLIFADHGFRLSADGRTFTHGGPSTLERVVPVLLLSPL